MTCTAWNNAVDPQGNHNSGTSSVTVHIDEAPPLLSLEPVNPNDPTALVADTSDSESGVAGGSVEIAPAGTGAWTSLPTTFTGSQLLAHFNDAGLNGPYSFRDQLLRQRRKLRLDNPDRDAAGAGDRDLPGQRQDAAHRRAAAARQPRPLATASRCTNRSGRFEHRSAEWTVCSDSCARRHVPVGRDAGASVAFGRARLRNRFRRGRPAGTVTP